MQCLSKILLVLSIALTSPTFAIDKSQQHDISLIINAFKNHDKKAISALIAYPLTREYPIPAVQNEAELISRFDDVFDQSLIEKIAHSDVEEDWNAVAWRGIMFSNGKLWLDAEGKISAINHQTEKAQIIKVALIETQKQALHESIRVYKHPILEWQTSRFHIRIDALDGGNYRYTSWGIDTPTSEPPDLVLSDGEVIYEGSGGNHYYVFTHGAYSYRCYVNVIGSDESAMASVHVYQGEKLLLSDDAVDLTGKRHEY